MEFSILGALEVAAEGERLELGGSRQQVVAATLLLGANRLVTIERLLSAMYGEELPPTSRSQAQISVSSLRRVFASHSSAELILTHTMGYVMRVGAGELDSVRFDELVAAARAARDAKRVEEAVASYRDALRLWRGPALDGIDSELVRAAASRLDEQHIAINEERIDLELDLGRHHELVGELTELIQLHPLREELRGQLMLALYRCDRIAESLQVYRQARRTMLDELGLEPSEQLKQLEHAILISDSSLGLPQSPVTIQPLKRAVPSLLPTDIADFTGRAEQIEQIRRHLLHETEAGRAVPVVVIVGKGGVGKTSLALHVSHGMTSHFSAGQLFADLHGWTPRPVEPMQVLERFLRVLGVPSSQIPEGLDERAEVYRNLIADQKMLVVIDDAATEGQIWPLLPGSSATAVIITSRTRLAGLPGAVHVEVDVFDVDKSLELLTRIVGAARIQPQSAAAIGVGDACGHLPLALRIAGARLSGRPHWSIQQLLDRLADETRRLDELTHRDMGIRPSISLTYGSMSDGARRLLRRLALLDMPVFSGWLCAALLDQPLPYAEELLDDLVSAQLIELAGPGSEPSTQYHFHELIRVFARERLAAEESAAERRAALERAFGGLLHLSEQAHIRYYGGDYVRLPGITSRWRLPKEVVHQLVRDPLSWYEQERSALVSGVRQAAHGGHVELCWALALSAVTLFESRAYLDDWEETHDVALEATRRAGDVCGEAAMLYSIGSLRLEQQRFDQARRDLESADQLFRDIGNDKGVGLVARHLAYLDSLAGRFDEATDRYQQALAIFHRTEDHIAAAYVLQNLARVKLELNEVDDARELLSDALQLTRAASSPRVQAQVLHRIGEANLQADDINRAVEMFEAAIETTKEIGDSIGMAYVLHSIGLARIRQGELDMAQVALQSALEIAGTHGERMAEVRALLGLTELALGSADAAQAVVLGQRAARISHEIAVPFYEARALIFLSEAHVALGNTDATVAAVAQAAAIHSKLNHETPPT